MLPTQVENTPNNVTSNPDCQQNQILAENASGRSSKSHERGSAKSEVSHDKRRADRDMANGLDRRPSQEQKPSLRNSHQLGRQSSDGDSSQRAHRRNESDSRLGLLRRQHTDVALARRSDVYRNSKVEISFPASRSDVTSSVAGEPVLTDFVPVAGDERQRSSGESGRPELRRQVSLDGDLSSAGGSGREPPRHEWNQRREKTDVDLRRAELRNELERWRVNPQEGRSRDSVSSQQQLPAHQVSWCGFNLPAATSPPPPACSSADN